TLAVPSDATDAAAETQRFDAEAGNARAEAPGTHGAIGTVPPPPMPAPAAAPQAEARTLSAVAETTVAKAAEPRAGEPADLRRRAQDAPQVEPSRPRERYPDMVRDPDARPADAARAAAAPSPYRRPPPSVQPQHPDRLRWAAPISRGVANPLRKRARVAQSCGAFRVRPCHRCGWPSRMR